MIHKICGGKQGVFCSISNISLKSQCFPTFLTSGPLVDKQQKTGELVENIKFSLDNQLNFLFATFSLVFCFYPLKGLRFLYIFGDPGLLCGVPFLQYNNSCFLGQ